MDIDSFRALDKAWLSDALALKLKEKVLLGPHILGIEITQGIQYFRASQHLTDPADHDRVRRTADGDLVVVGRAKDQINRGGEKIAAEEVEAHLLAHPDIVEAALVALPDRALGEKPCAFVVGRDTLPTTRALQAFLRARGIADYKIPDRCIAIDALPRTPVGKIDKPALRRLLAAPTSPTEIALP